MLNIFRRKKKKHKDIRDKHSQQRKVSDESTSTASEGGDYCESVDDTGDCKWAEKKVEKKLGAKSPKGNKEQGKKDHGQQPDDREMKRRNECKSQSNSRGKVKEERKGQNETKTRSDLKRSLSQESRGSQSGTLSRSRSRSRTRRSRENSRSRSRDRTACKAIKGSRQGSRSTSRDRRACRSTK